MHCILLLPTVHLGLGRSLRPRPREGVTSEEHRLHVVSTLSIVPRQQVLHHALIRRNVLTDLDLDGLLLEGQLIFLVVVAIVVIVFFADRFQRTAVTDDKE